VFGANEHDDKLSISSAAVPEGTVRPLAGTAVPVDDGDDGGML
jgi:hypothetical protein